MEYIAFFAVAFIIVLFIFVYGKIEEHKSKIWLYKKRKELFGNFPNKSYPDNRFSTLMQRSLSATRHNIKQSDKMTKLIEVVFCKHKEECWQTQKIYGLTNISVYARCG